MNSYTFHITLYDLAFLGAIFIGLAFAVQLWFAKTVNRSANRFLALALATMVVWMARILAVDIRLETYLPRWHWLPMQFLLALGPLMYFYVLNITRPQYKFKWKNLLHFTLVLLEQVALALEIKESAKTGAATYNTHAFQLLNPVLQLLIFISIIAYLYQCNKLIQKFYRRLQPVLMDRPLVEFRWLRRLLIATAVLWFLWILCAAVNYFGYHNQPGVHVYYPFYIFFVVIIIWTAAAALLKPQAAAISQAATRVNPPVPVELRAKGAWLKRAMEAKLYYQDPELSLSSLAEKTNMPPHELSRVINTVFKKGFNDFVNEYRVREVIQKLQNPAYDNMTLVGIAYEAGFNSQSTFSRIFKQMTGKSPAEVKKSPKKDFPSYNLSNQVPFGRLISNQQTTHKWTGAKLNRSYMFKTYLKIAWRNFKNNNVFSFINIIGLSTGLVCCMLITLYINNELSYDAYQQNKNDIYQIGTDFLLQGKEAKWPNTPAAMGLTMQHVFPEIEQWARLAPLTSEDKTLLQYRLQDGGTKSFYEEQGYLADSTFFRMFTYNFIEGDAATALVKPNTVVLSQEIAQKLFGSQPALHKVIHVSSSTNGDYDFLVTGVFKPINKPSHIDGRFFMSMAGGGIEQNIKAVGDDLATNNQYYTYLLLKPGSNVQNMASQMPAFIDKYAGKALKAMGFSKKQVLIPLQNIHLRSGLDKEVTPPGSVVYLYILGCIAIFTLLIACINFMNLSTARSSKRSAEVGIRKVMGAEKSSLIQQFLGESLVMSFVAFLLALVITELLLGAFNQVSGKSLTLSLTGDAGTIITFLGLSLLTGLLAGSYPAFYLSSFIPIKVLKGRFSNSLAAASLRKGLVVFQFFISVVLIIASMVIANQMQYLRSTDLGFDKDRQIIIPLQSQTAKNAYTSLKAQLGNQPQISGVAGSAFYPGSNNLSDILLYKAGESMSVAKEVRKNFVDYNYLTTLGIKPAAGRLFSEQFQSDTNNTIILNEMAVNAIGFASAEKAVGQNVYFDFGTQHFSFKIVGVVKDFHFEDLHLPIAPYAFSLSQGGYNYMTVHAKPGDITQTLAAIKTAWHSVNPNEPFECSFLDDDFQKNYDAENRLASIVGYFTAVAILISCLGLFGLATFSAEQRIKEIGVRKVLGASVASIVALLSKDFLKLVGISIVIASPVAWWLMHSWLQGFAYHISITWVVFAITAFAALFISLATISFQAVRAALMNPVKAIRTE